MHRARARRIQVVARGEVEAVVAGLVTVALVTGPPEVLQRSRERRIRKRVDLFPCVPAHVAEPHLVGAGLEREPERVPQSVRDQPLLVRIRAGRVEQGITRDTQTSVGIDANDRAVERGLATVDRRRLLRAQPLGLGTQRAALCARRRVRVADAAGRVATRVGRNAVATRALAVVGGVEVRAVAAACVELPVGSERDRADRVARVLPAPVFDQHLLIGHRAAHARQGELRDAPARDAAVHRGGGARVIRTVAGPPPGRGTRVAEHVVVRILDVEKWTGRAEVGIDREPQQALVPVVVDLGAQVGDEMCGRVADAVVAIDASRFLGDEHLAVGRELDRGRLVTAGEDGGVLKQCRERGGRPRAEGRQHCCRAERSRECHRERD